MMHDRPQRLPDPVGKRYVTVGFSEGETFTFRRPGLEDYATILGRWERMVTAYRQTVARLEALAKEIREVGDGDPAPLLEEAQSLAEQLPAAQVAMAAGAGFMIGRMWADPVRTLWAVDWWEQAAADPKGRPYPANGREPWMAFGLDVYSELCDAIGAGEVLDLAGTLHAQTASWMAPAMEGEVRRKAKVFPRT